jgi:hypothetical protein
VDFLSWAKLNWTLAELLLNGLALNWLRIFPELRYITSAPTAQKTRPLLLKHLHQSLHSNGCGAGNSETIVVCVTQQRAANTRSSIAWRLTAEMCLPLYCVATSKTRRGMRYSATSSKHSYFYCCVHVSRFLRPNSSRMGQTRYNMNSFFNENFDTYL